MVQIPLLWQLTDALSGLGLGFAYALGYWLLSGVCRIVPGRRRVRRGAGDALWAMGCVLFTRAWVLTGSRAAQLRWSLVLAVCAGYALFWHSCAPALQRCTARAARVLRPAGRLLLRLHRRRFCRHLPRREARRRAYEQRCTARQRRKMPGKAPETRSRGKEFHEKEAKRLKSERRVYYNNN